MWACIHIKTATKPPFIHPFTYREKIIQQYMKIVRSFCTTVLKRRSTGHNWPGWPSLKYSNLRLYGRGEYQLWGTGLWSRSDKTWISIQMNYLEKKKQQKLWIWWLFSILWILGWDLQVTIAYKNCYCHNFKQNSVAFFQVQIFYKLYSLPQLILIYLCSLLY